MLAQEMTPLLAQGSRNRVTCSVLYLRKLLWYTPVILYSFLTLEFIRYVISNSTKVLPKRYQQSEKCNKIGKCVMRIGQALIFVLFTAQVVFQFVLFWIDENVRNSRNSTSLNNDIIGEVLFVTDLIDSLISLGSCYFIFVNSDIFKRITFRIPLAPSTKDELSFPASKNKIFSGIAIFFAYLIIIILPFLMACIIFSKFKSLSWVNTYIEIFPLELETKNPTNHDNEEHNLWYKYLTYIITIHWHLSPVFACITVRYICEELQYQVKIAVMQSKDFIKAGNMENWSLKIQRPILAYYELTSRVKEYSKVVHYVATINIIAVFLILTSLFTSYVGSDNIGFTQKLAEIGKTNDRLDVLIAFRTPFIYMYQFISVWLMSDAIIALNTKLEKFSDSVLSEDENAITHFVIEEGMDKFKNDMKLELSMISASKERFEIAFLGDYSISVFNTIIPFGVGALLNFIIRTIDAMRFLNFDN